MKKLLSNSLLTLALLTASSAHAGWQVQWIDTFEGNSVDWTNWTAQIQANYNNEVQCYTDDESSQDKNFEVSDGTLKIIARKQSINCPGLGGAQKSWTSGRINSKDKAEFLYGRVESRIKFHNLEGGTWPAFWMLENRIAEQPKKNDNDFVNWPNPGAGEIDVWEWFSNQPNTYITNFFNTNGCGREVRYTYPNGGTDVLDWHKYAMEWDENSIRFYIDDTLVSTQNISSCAQYKEPMFILLNVAMGGNLGGNIDSSLTKATMEVDYVAHCTSDSSNSATYCDEATPGNIINLDDDNDGINNDQDLCPATPINSSVDNDGCVIEEQPAESTPEQVNQSPLAIALASSAKAFSGDYVMLSAEQSSDADGDILQYFWQQTNGTNVELINHTSSSPTFLAPEVLEQTTLTFKVEVSDGDLTDTATISQEIYPIVTDTVEAVVIDDVEEKSSSGGSLLFCLTATFMLLFRRRKG